MAFFQPTYRMLLIEGPHAASKTGRVRGSCARPAALNLGVHGEGSVSNTTADIMIETLQDWGVEVVFGLPGDGINGIIEALRKRQEKIRFIQVRHEEAARGATST